MTADDIKFRASRIGAIMTEPRSKSQALSETCKTYLTEVYINEKYGRKKEIENDYITKGLLCEENSLTLYSRYKKIFYKKNEHTIENEFICGTPDVIQSEMIDGVFVPSLIVDLKSSWSIFTFFNEASDLNKTYYWQLQSYMALTGATQAILAYCLVNTPDVLINDQKRRLQWKMGVIDDANFVYQQACDEIDRLSIYDDIPMSERVIEIPIQRDEEAIERIYQRVKDCREYMNTNLFKLQTQTAWNVHDAIQQC